MSEETKREPVKYTVLEKSLIGNKLFEAGETCEYDGLPAENLAPQCDEGKSRYAEYVASNKARQLEMKALYSDQPAVSMDPAVFGKAVAAELAKLLGKAPKAETKSDATLA